MLFHPRHVSESLAPYRERHALNDSFFVSAVKARRTLPGAILLSARRSGNDQLAN
jgi:hypothetical protein